jgi:hypothetical protein
MSKKMNKEEARLIVAEELKKYETMPYEQLRNFVLQEKVDAYEVNRSNTTYEIDITFLWDDHLKKNDIRVIGHINVSGGWSAFRPLTGDFIMRPDGTLVDIVPVQPRPEFTKKTIYILIFIYGLFLVMLVAIAYILFAS